MAMTSVTFCGSHHAPGGRCIRGSASRYEVEHMTRGNINDPSPKSAIVLD